MKIKRNTYRVGIDARYDLQAAGLDASEADAMEEAWVDALDHLADLLGLDVADVHTTYDSAHAIERCTRTDLGDTTVEQILWQAAHDSIARTQDGRWVTVDHGQVADLRRSLAAAVCEAKESEA